MTEKSFYEKISHKGCKVRLYTVEFKMDAIKYAEIHGKSASARKFNVDRKSVVEWVQKKDMINALSSRKFGRKRKHLDGGGRKPLSEEMEERLLHWILERRGKRLHLSRKLITKKAKSTYAEMKKRDQALPEEFLDLATVGWLNILMKRHGLSLVIIDTDCPL